MYDLKALYEAESVAHAIQLLQEHPEAQIIAGGSDVLVQMREGRRAGKELVSIYRIDEMRGISYEEDGAIRIGSLTSFSHITKDPIIQKHINVLGEAVDMVGGPQIRNIGTIGGNTCNGVTSADSASTLHAWDAIVEITGPDGVRRIPIHDFYIKAGVVDLKPAEIQTAIIIPKEAYEGYHGHYIKYAMRNAMDIATTGCSVNVKLSEDKKTIKYVRIAYGVQDLFRCVHLLLRQKQRANRLQKLLFMNLVRLFWKISIHVTAGEHPRHSVSTSLLFLQSVH